MLKILLIRRLVLLLYFLLLISVSLLIIKILLVKKMPNYSYRTRPICKALLILSSIANTRNINSMSLSIFIIVRRLATKFSYQLE